MLAMFVNILYSSFTESADNSEFPSSPEQVKTTPVCKIKERFSKHIHRPASILLDISKVFIGMYW